jgi:DNA-binding beta-propeller fold protein YncE
METSMLALALVAALVADTAKPSGELVIVANKQAASASIIEASTGTTLATLPVGNGPHEVAVSRDGRWAVVTNYGAQTPGNSLTVLDLSTLTVARTIDLGEYRRPHGAAFIGSTMKVAVTSEVTRMVVIVDAAAGTVTNAIPTNAPGSHMVGVTADGSRAWTANIGDGSVSEIDLRAESFLRQLPVSTRTEGIGVAPDGRTVWVGSNDQHTVSVVDPAQAKVAAVLPSPGFPYRVSMSPDGRYAVVPQPEGDAVRIFDVATRKELGVVTVSGQPVGTVVSGDSKVAYVSLQGTNEVAVVDLEKRVEVKRFPSGAGPDGIAVSGYYNR